MVVFGVVGRDAVVVFGVVGRDAVRVVVAVLGLVGVVAF